MIKKLFGSSLLVVRSRSVQKSNHFRKENYTRDGNVIQKNYKILEILFLNSSKTEANNLN